MVPIMGGVFTNQIGAFVVHLRLAESCDTTIH